MLRSIAPIASRLRHLRPHVMRARMTATQRPRAFSVATAHTPDVAGIAPGTRQARAVYAPTLGQLLAESTAARIGSWAFLIIQSAFLLGWVVYNGVGSVAHWPTPDAPPYILLNLLLSFQAAFTGPVLLIAANVGAIRDHAQADRMEALAEQNAQLLTMLDAHANGTAREHTEQLAALHTLVADMREELRLTRRELAETRAIAQGLRVDPPPVTGWARRPPPNAPRVDPPPATPPAAAAAVKPAPRRRRPAPGAPPAAI